MNNDYDPRDKFSWNGDDVVFDVSNEQNQLADNQPHVDMQNVELKPTRSMKRKAKRLLGPIKDVK